MIIIPNVKKASDNTGIINTNGHFYACYKKDGKQKRAALGAAGDGDLPKRSTRKERDKFYAELVAAGATVATRSDRKAKVGKDPDKYIRYRKPFAVVIAGQLIAECDTKPEARKARDKHLGIR